MPGRVQLEQGERRVTVVRRHWWMLVRPALALLPILLALPVFSALDVALPSARLARYSSLFLLVDLSLAGLLLLKWVTVNALPWWLECYVVTDRRVIAQRGVLTVERREASLRNVHESSYSISGAEARLFNYGDLVLQTAGKGKGVIFTAVPHPQRLQSLVATQARAARAALQQQRGTESEIGQALQRIFNGTVGVHDSPTQRVPRISKNAARFQRRLSLLQDETVLHATRRHPIVLCAALAKPVLAAVLLGILVHLVRTIPVDPLAALMTALFGWMLWSIVDWRDDLYVLTSERVINVQRRPFVFEMRVVVPLRGISDVVLRISSLTGRIFHVGSLNLETTGEALELEDVPQPEYFQRLIFAQLDDLSRGDRLREQERLAGTLTEWFKEYHRMQDDAATGKVVP